MEERLRFVHDALSDRYTMSELCARDGVSRRVGYVWLARYEAEGRRGLIDRSHAPHHCPHKNRAAMADLLVADPLTLADQHTRVLLACRGLLSMQTVTAHPVFERAFRESGLPLAIRTDNGVPFATQAIHGLSYLNVWSMRLGIQHQRSRPGCPQDNGAYERMHRMHRMHRTLKRQAIKPVRAHCAAQQCNVDAFQHEYNVERPHERLHQ